MTNHNHEQDPTLSMARRILAILGIVLIAAGEYLIVVPPLVGEARIPSYFWISIFGMLLLVISLFLKTRATLEAKLSKLKISNVSFEIILAILLCGLTILSTILFQKYDKNNYIPVVLTWFASGGLYIIAFRNTDSSNVFNLIAWIKKYKVEIIILSIAIVIGTILRFYKLGDLPRVIDGDEGAIGLRAVFIARNGLSNPFALWENFGSLYLQAVNWGLELFGISPFSLRLLPAISGVLAIPALYLFARQIAGPRVAMIAAYLLATSHSHLHFSRISSVGYIHATWLVPLELYLLLSAIEKRSSWRAAASGVILAIHLRVYLTSQIIVVLVFVYMLIAFLFLRPWFKPALRQAAVFWGGFFLMLAPQLIYIYKYPSEFMNRLSRDGTFQSGWLQMTMANTGRSAFDILLERAIHAFMSLIYYPAVDFYGSTIPLLNVFAATFFLVGMALVLVRVKSPGHLLLNGYLWGLTLAIAIFSIPPSADSYRMLSVLPACFLMAAIGLDQLLEIAGFQWQTSSRIYTTLAVGLIIGISIMNVRSYFFDFAGKCLYGGGLETRFMSYLGLYAKTVDKDSTIYLLRDENFFYGSHPSVDFLSGGRMITNYEGPMDSYQVTYGETIIATPNRIEELLAWAQIHPGGELTSINDCEQVILVSYKIPAKTFEP
jgi:hypothetical protein